ncbi:SRPBCC family protein [Actinomycetospora sp. CA-101289]|uniref:SRPBCC family protein n=1 Tax=Actinomycetospora sp. CA-101289 TaxID=3239893 RepID=UPI003D97C733
MSTMTDAQPHLVTRSAVVAGPPSAVFAVLADPRAHAALDGSGLVKGLADGPERLADGDEFTMRMKGYRTVNTVVEYIPDARIAWRHTGRHVWRWELAEVPGGTEVHGTFDYSAKRSRRFVELLGFPRRAGRALDGTLTVLQTRFA